MRNDEVTRQRLWICAHRFADRIAGVRHRAAGRTGSAAARDARHARGRADRSRSGPRLGCARGAPRAAGQPRAGCAGRHHPPMNCRGFTLTELVIAMLLFSMASAGGLTAWAHSHAAWQEAAREQLLHERAQYVMATLEPELQ